VRSREYYWSLYHKTEKKQLDDLRTDQIEAIHAAIPKKMHGEYLIWRDGFDNWKAFEDFPQLLVSLRRVDQQPVEAPPPPTPAQVAAKPASQAPSGGATRIGTIVHQADFELDLSGPSLAIDEQGAKEGRNNFRFQKKFEVRVASGTQTYTFQTVNVSLKGMQLDAALPEDLPGYFNVEVRHRDKAIQMVCSAVKNEDGRPSDRLKIEINDFTTALLTMLLGA
jgi:PilZ domain